MDRTFARVGDQGAVHRQRKRATLFRWKKGFVAPPHKHLSASHTFIISGKLKVRDAILNEGDYVYEPNGMLHGATEALEDTVYLFICNGPSLYFDDNGFTSYLGLEENERMRHDALATKPGQRLPVTVM
jgi:quercetin dioxygenase-like cupin family protein